MKTQFALNMGLLVSMVLSLASCETPTTPVPPEKVLIAQAVETGATIPRDAEAQTTHVCNCGIMKRTMTKQVERSRASAYAVQWEVGGEIGTGAEIPVIGGLSIDAALSAAYGSQWESSKSNSVSFPLEAEPGTNMEYTILWREIWQPGYIPVDTPKGKQNINYEYLVFVEGDIINSKDLGCAKGCEVERVTPTLLLPISTSPPPTSAIPGGHQPTPAMTLTAIPTEVILFHTLYDDFTSPLGEKWRVDDKYGLCTTLNVSKGQLLFDCGNNATEDRGASLHAIRLSSKTLGIAALTSVEKAGGDFQLTTRWMCPDSGSERAYHIRLDTDSAEAIEFYPQEGWRKVELGRVSVKPG